MRHFKMTFVLGLLLAPLGCGDDREETCDDGVRNQDESAIDCGGSSCGTCENLMFCDVAGDCESGVCTDNRCAPGLCGDGVVSADEECDEMLMVTETCNGNCTLSVCGDGIMNPEAGEECDDGNLDALDDCDANCELQCLPGEQTFLLTGQIETFTMPGSCQTLTISAAGAEGGAGGGTGGLGANVQGTFQTEVGQVFQIAVGEWPATTNGGGGGSFVVDQVSATPLIIAGGGGGGAGRCCGTVYDGADASLSTSGTAGVNAGASGGEGGIVGGGGRDGGATRSSGAGGGFLTDGEDGINNLEVARGGRSFANGLLGGSSDGPGGFGGGGASSLGGTLGAGGGGGGYSGGGNAGFDIQWGAGGGGGSLLGGSDPITNVGHSGDGFVVLTWAE